MASCFELPRRAFALGLLSAPLLPAAACGQSTPTASGAAVREPVRTTGFDPGLLQGAVERAGALPQLRSLILARDGRALLERAVRGPGLDTPVNIKSASKTVLAAVAGAALDRGVLQGLGQPVLPLLRLTSAAGSDPRLARITVEHLLSMEAGLEPTSGANYGAWVSSRDWVGYALARPFVDEPGGRMIYSTGTSHLLSAALTSAAGRSTLELARDWIGRPLGVEVPPWPQDPRGIYFGGNDMLMSPRALLRFGEMFRNGGVHGGTRVLSERFVQDAWRSRGGRSPWTGYTYGLGWWIRQAGAREVFFAWGYGGQMLFVVPSLALTAVMTSDPAARGVDGHVQALHALLDGYVIPAAERGAAA